MISKVISYPSNTKEFFASQVSHHVFLQCKPTVWPQLLVYNTLCWLLSQITINNKMRLAPTSIKGKGYKSFKGDFTFLIPFQDKKEDIVKGFLVKQAQKIESIQKKLKCEIHTFSLQKSVKMNDIMCLSVDTQMKINFQNLKIDFHVLQLIIKFFL